MKKVLFLGILGQTFLHCTTYRTQKRETRNIQKTNRKKRKEKKKNLEEYIVLRPVLVTNLFKEKVTLPKIRTPSINS